MNDDLDDLSDHAVLAALRAPAQPHELAGEQDALQMFRRSSRVRRRRGLRRTAVGGITLAVGLTLTGGVAAAYTDNLPDPLQNAVHSALAPLPIPGPPSAHRHRRAGLRRPRAGTPGSSAPRHPVVALPTPLPGPSGIAAAPTPRVSDGPSPQPSTSPTPAAPPTLTATVSPQVVAVHGHVVLSGRLSRDGAALGNRRVYAAELIVGESTWRRVASAVTGSDGSVAITVPPLTSNVRLRLATDRVVSSAWRVAVVPTLSLSASRSGGQRVETVTADGGRPGDTLVLLRRDGDTWTTLATTTLDGQLSGTFTVPGPSSARVRYRVRLATTAQHAASINEFVVPAR